MGKYIELNQNSMEETIKEIKRYLEEHLKDIVIFA